MSESESEDEILDRIEAALRKIAGLSNAAPRPEAGEAPDRAALVEKLDGIIARLREGLGAPVRENSSAHLREDLNAPARDELENPRSEPGE
ncbi:MAG TPA: hypothetical protein VEQ16_08935 [Acidocella sp.]|jgi:hypothetical protein|nr:hypothetical protein [Acidocella sp.]